MTRFKIVTPIEDFVVAKKCGYHLDIVQRAAIFNAINRGFEREKSITWKGEDQRHPICAGLKHLNNGADILLEDASAMSLLTTVLGGAAAATTLLAF